MIRKFLRLLCFALTIICVVSSISVSTWAANKDNNIDLSGSGKVNDPYLIQSLDDLIKFRDSVDSGNEFEGEYFLQTLNIDLSESDETKIWDPIGEWGEEHYFYGIYNGGGHFISNLYTDSDFSGFFTRLGGTVMNLGIESGSINGNYVGAITSHANGPDSQIINCYSLADVNGTRAGGIADNFTAGIIADTWCAGKITGTVATGGIVSYNVTLSSNCVYVGDISPLPENFDNLNYNVYTVDPSNADIDSLREQFKNNTRVNVSPLTQLLKGAKGDGTVDDPYQIVNAEQLVGLSNAVRLGYSFSGKNIVQTADIDLRNVDFFPIGNEENVFGGIYDGGGHKISNLYIKDTEYDGYIGLFGTVSSVIMNVNLDSGYIEGNYAAGIVGESDDYYAMIINCRNNANVVGIESAGGIANNFEGGIIVNCLNTGRVTAQEIYGGVIGESVNRMLDSHSVGSPVSHEDTEGVIISSCRQFDNVDDAVRVLNANLYDTATFTNLQRNNLVKWNSNGSLSLEYHNYFLPYLLNFALTSLILFVALFVILLIYKTYKRGATLSLRNVGETISLSKQEWKTNTDGRFPFIIGAGFVASGVLILAAYITGNNLITKDFGYSSAALYDFIVPLRSALNDNCADNGYYTIIGETYPPIARLVLFSIGKLMPTETQFVPAALIKEGYGTFVIIMYLFACLALFYYACSKLNKNKYTVLTVFAIISSPMLFMIDRANILCLVVALSALFVAGYRSENAVIRHLSYVCLGFAAAIKLYPVVLGLLVLKEKKAKHTIQCITYGIIICVVPFLVLGFEEIGLYIRNVSQSFDDNLMEIKEWLVDYTHIFQSWFYKLFNNPSLGESIGKLTLYPYTALLVACTFLTKERWKAVTAVMMIQILFPGFTVFYCMALFAIPMMMFVSVKHTRKIDYLYALLFLFILVPLQFLGGAMGLDKADIWFIGGNACFILSVVLIIDCAYETIKRIKSKKQTSVNVAMELN